jgi:hypothetical protein
MLKLHYYESPYVRRISRTKTNPDSSTPTSHVDRG